MRRMTFYRLCLLMPLLMPLPLVLGVDRATLQSDSFLYSLIAIGEWILRLGGIPYALLATLLFVRSFRWTSREMRQKLARSPFWMIPFQYAFTVPWYITTGSLSTRELGDIAAVLFMLLIPVSLLTLLVGYFYVLLATGLERMQERHCVLLPHDYPPAKPGKPFRLARKTYYRLWLPIPVLASLLGVAVLRRAGSPFQDADFWFGCFFVFGLLPYLIVAVNYYIASFSLSAWEMKDALLNLPVKMLTWMAGIIFFFSIPTLGILFLFAMPCAALADFVLGYAFILVACTLEKILDRYGILTADA